MFGPPARTEPPTRTQAAANPIQRILTRVLSVSPEKMYSLDNFLTPLEGGIRGEGMVRVELDRAKADADKARVDAEKAKSKIEKLKKTTEDLKKEIERLKSTPRPATPAPRLAPAPGNRN